MKRLICQIILTAILGLLTGCSGNPAGAEQFLVSPQNREIPIKGTWEAAAVLEGDVAAQELSPIQFTDKYILIGSYLLEKPLYKTKSVSGQDYLLYSHKSFPGLQVPSGSTQVITVTDKDRFFCEILMLGDKEMILQIRDYSLHLKKLTDEVDEKQAYEWAQKSTNNLGLYGDTKQDSARTGVMLGLRQSKKNGSYAYRTLWIASDKNQLHPILQTSDIFFPRQSGYCRLKVNPKETLVTVKVEATAKPTPTPEKTGTARIQDAVLRTDVLHDEDCRITYIGNDYMSLEGKAQLQIIPIDSLPNIRGIKIGDLMGDSGTSTLRTAAAILQHKLQLKDDEILNQWDIDQSIGLERKMGHWFLKGRLNYIQGIEHKAADYPISILPPTKLVMFDESIAPWKDIKDKVPEATDAFCSPNRDIVLIATRTDILIYGIEKGQLSASPKKKMPLKDGESIIMAEWATGRYVEYWEKTFVSITQNKGE